MIRKSYDDTPVWTYSQHTGPDGSYYRATLGDGEQTLIAPTKVEIARLVIQADRGWMPADLLDWPETA